MANHADVSANSLTPSPDLATIQTSPFPSGAAGDSPEPSPVQAALDFQRIPLDLITPSKTNTRTEYAGPEFEELVADIKARGVLMPVLVRRLQQLLRQITFELKDGSKLDMPPAPFHAGMVDDAMRECGISEDDVERTAISDSGYELIAGERRYRASLAAGLTEIPARVVEMNDAQAVEAQLVENLQRKNLKPLEEARGYIELLDVMAKEQPEAKREDLIKQLARRVNKAPRTVYGMMQLTRLIPEVQKALEDGGITASHGDLLVRLEENDQREIFDEGLFERVWDSDKKENVRGDAISIRALKLVIADDYRLKLDAAPWKKDDSMLVPKAGACSTCPKNTMNDAFGGDVKHPECSDRSCFKTKREAYLNIRVAEAKQKNGGKQPMLLRETYGAYDGPAALWKSEWEHAPKAEPGSCKSSETGVVVDGSNLGRITTFCRDYKCGIHHPESKSTGGKQAKPSADAKNNQVEQAKREEEEWAKRERDCAGDVAVFRAILERTKTLSTDALLLVGDTLLGATEIEDVGEWALAEFFGWQEPQQKSYGWLSDTWKKNAGKLSVSQQAQFLLGCVIAEGIGADSYMNFTPEKLDALAKEYKLDPKAMRAKAVAATEAKQNPAAGKLQTPAKKANAAKAQPAAKPKTLSPVQLASIKPEPKTSTAAAAKKSAGKKSPAKKSAKKGGRK